MKIAILGSAFTSYSLAPFNDPSWDIWVCSPGTLDAPRITFRFELHTLDLIERDYPGDDIEVLRLQPTYMHQAFPDFPLSIEFPKDKLVAKYGRDWFTSSISWMLALAIEQKPTHIGIWGVDMDELEEYSHQRPGCLYFIEKAKQAGIDVFVPDESVLLKTSKLYGYE